MSSSRQMERNVEHTVENSMCQNFGNEAVCRDSTSLKILAEMRQIYEDRLREIDKESGGGMEIKLKALTSWINDLEEQNVLLVQTVEQLEREAADRVALLEKRLKKSSHIALEYMSKLEDYDNQMLDISEEKDKVALMHIKASTRLVQAQQTEEILKTRVGNLQNDISGLLELIRRARYYGSWDADGISFMEVAYEDIFGTHPNQEIMQLQEQVACQKADIALKEVQLKCLAEKTQEFQVPAELKHIMHMVPKSIVCNFTVMTDTNTGESSSEKVSLTQDDQSEDEMTPVVSKSVVCDVAVMTDTDPAENKMENFLLKQGNHQSENEVCKNQFDTLWVEESNKANAIMTLTKKLENTELQLQTVLQQNEKLSNSIACLSLDVKKKAEEIGVLSQNLNEIDKSFKQTKANLTADVAEKNEQLLALKDSVELLQKHISEVDFQTHCKDAIIKEMRKHIRLARTKMPERAPVPSINKKGVCFAPPSNEDYEEQIVELQKALKEAQNGTESATKHIAENERNFMKDESQFTRHVEECRVNTVLAQAATEEVMEEIENLLDKLQAREGKIQVMEISIHSLQNSLKRSEQDINVLLKSLLNEVPEKYLTIKHLQDNLKILLLEIKEVREKIDEQVHDKETWHHSQKQSEEKIKKLQLELESVQEDLEQSLKCFEPADDSSSLHLE